MSSENVAPPNNLIAAVLSTGLSLGIIPREAVVAWADYLIEGSEAAPPAWLIDLSLSQDLHPLDVLSILNTLAQSVDRADICRAIYGFMQRPSGQTPDETAIFAEQLYKTTYDLLDGDWTSPLLRRADDVADALDFIREGYLKMSPEQGVDDVNQFLKVNRDCRVKDLLDRCVRRTEDRAKGVA